MGKKKNIRKQVHLANGTTIVPYKGKPTPINKNSAQSSFNNVAYKNNGIKSKNSVLYYEDRNRQVFKLALLGLEIKEMADVLGIKKETLQKWMGKYPELNNSYEAGKIQASANVASALYQKAIGFSHPEQKVFMNKIKEYDPETGKVVREYSEPMIVDVVKHYPPDFASMNKFLTIKEPEKWNDKFLVDDIPITFGKASKELEDVSIEELALMEKIGMKEKKAV